MKRGILPRAAVVMLGIVMFFSVGAWAGEKVGDIDVSIQPLPSKDNAYGSTYGVCHGYVEFRLRLKNMSNEDRIVHLSYPATSGYVVNDGVVMTRKVRVAGGQEAAVSLFQPPIMAANDRLQVRVEGMREPRTITLESLHAYRYNNESPAAVLISRGVPQEFRDREHPVPVSSPGTTVSPEIVSLALLRTELSVEQWSQNWLGYSCYDAIVLTAKEAEEMPPQVQLAVRRFVECGGTLLVHGREVPAALVQGGTADDLGGWPLGFGYAIASQTDGAPGWKAIHQMLNGKPITVRRPTGKVTKSIGPLHVHRPEGKPSNHYGLLIAETTVPVRGLFVLVLLFGVGIGPANLWILSRYKRRIWLWWTVPAISLLTCLVVFAYSLAAEGITGRGKTASLTILDERCHRATTIGYVSYYCPLTPWSGPRFGVDTDVALLDIQRESWRPYRPRGSSTSLRCVDWTEDQHLTSGWVTARVPAYFQFRKNEDRRERLTVGKNADGSPRIVNALGADIERLYWADPSGRVYEGRDIPAGAERTLSAAAFHCGGPGEGHAGLKRLFHSSDWLATFKLWENDIHSYRLSPGCYIAYLKKSPFVESALASVEPEHTVAIVYGISKESGDGR